MNKFYMKFKFDQKKLGLSAAFILFFVILVIFERLSSPYSSGSPDLLTNEEIMLRPASPTLLKNEDSIVRNASFSDLKPSISTEKSLATPPISIEKFLATPPTSIEKFLATPPISESSPPLVPPSECHIYDGKWEKDTKNMPLYNGKSCSWLSQHWACKRGKNSTFEYEMYSWRPAGCDLPEFQRENFLEEFKNQTVMFSGDSLGRQQFQSFLCLVDPDKDNPEKLEDVGHSEFGFYTPKGRRGPTGHAYRFTRVNLTVIFFGSDALCELKDSDPVIGEDGTKTKRVELHIDRIKLELQKLVEKSTTVVFNSKHHWSRGKARQNGWVLFFENKELHSSHKFRDLNRARNVCVNYTISWLDSEVKKREKEGRDLLAVFRTYSPRHFTHGDWNTGGTCSQVKFGESLPGNTADLPTISAAKGKKVVVLDITAMSDLRGESHLAEWDLYKNRKGAMDCLHWCLPGVPDFWNGLLYWESFRRTKRI